MGQPYIQHTQNHIDQAPTVLYEPHELREGFLASHVTPQVVREMVAF